MVLGLFPRSQVAIVDSVVQLEELVVGAVVDKELLVAALPLDVVNDKGRCCCIPPLRWQHWFEDQLWEDVVEDEQLEVFW